MNGEEVRHPALAPIDAYGNGGFRFAGMSHRGSILALPSGMRAWSVAAAGAIDEDALAPVLAERSDIVVFLLGTGDRLVPLRPELRRRLEAISLAPDLMATGAAVRTYNVLLAEGRAVAAALIAVDAPR